MRRETQRVVAAWSVVVVTSCSKSSATSTGSDADPSGVSSPTTVESTASIQGSATVTNGRLPPAAIEGVVRPKTDPLASLRLCYEDGLRKNPGLAGHVVVKFVVDRKGEVATAMDGGSDLPDQDVVKCVVRRFAGLSFPVPDGGIATVIYSLTFAPR